MKKAVYYTILVMIAGCAGIHTLQPVEKISALNPGMSKQDVSRIMGSPVRTEFSGSKEAWHFCRTGNSSDEFAVVIFSEGKVVAAKNYNVPYVGGSGLENCSQFTHSIF